VQIQAHYLGGLATQQPRDPAGTGPQINDALVLKSGHPLKGRQ
jgi:hypothetical protein